LTNNCQIGDSKMTRKEFMKTTAMTAVSAARILGANERIGVALIGAGKMGRGDMSRALASKQVDVIAIADPSEPNMKQAIGMTSGASKGYKDFRHVLDSKQVDAVLIATPEHWHAIPMIMACQAGKDIYAEKPLSHTIYEGQRMVAAAKKYQRVVQVGTQRRSAEFIRRAVELVRRGEIGKVTSAEAWLCGNLWPDGYGKAPDSDPPSSLDWDMWLGPAPYHTYNPNRFEKFRTFWNYGGGAVSDWGPHLIDVIHWVMGVDAPSSVTSVGGKYVFEDCRETPDTVDVLFEYPASPVTGNRFTVRFSYRNANARGPDGRNSGVQFYGTTGTLLIDLTGSTLWREKGKEVITDSATSPNDPASLYLPHMLNFLECVRSRRKTNADIETLHRSTSAPIIGNIAYRLGRKLRWDRDAEKFIGDSEANVHLTKQYRKPWHLPEG
jgi:predicted dehydrogenase